MAVGSVQDFVAINTGTLDGSPVLKNTPKMNSLTGKSNPFEGIDQQKTDNSGPIKKLENVLNDNLRQRTDALTAGSTDARATTKSFMEAGKRATQASSVASGVGTNTNQTA